MAPYRVRYAPAAEAQLLALYRYVANAASPTTAERFTESIVQQCEALSTFPNRGTPRQDIRPNLRTLAMDRVLIAYSVEMQDVIILGVFYGGQDFEALLDES